MSKILIAEDDAQIASMYQFKLEKTGHQVKVAHNGEDALQLTEAFMPDLILLDLRMPLMSGDEMLEKLRTTDWGSEIRVIILTNISKDEAPSKLRFLNVDRYVVKAHNTPSEVVKVVDEVLSGK